MRGGSQMAKSKKKAVQREQTACECRGLDVESLCLTCGSPAPQGRKTSGMLSALKRHEALLAEIERVSSSTVFHIGVQLVIVAIPGKFANSKRFGAGA